jgi:hypothetical protein
MESGFSMLPLAALRDRRLTYRTLTVLGALCSFRQRSDDVSIVAGRDEIAERCQLHQSVISSATTELERLGWLEKVGRGGRSIKTTYRLTTPETVADSATVTKPETVTDYVSKTVADSATRLYRTEVNTDICVKKSKDTEPEGFADCWSAYPKREGGNSRTDALKAYRGRLKAGASPSDLLAGVKRYAAYCAAKSIVSTSYVKQASTFFGPGDHWCESWAVSTSDYVTDQKPKAGDTRARHGVTEMFNEVAGWVPA